MKEMLLNLLRSMIPNTGDFRVSYVHTEYEHNRRIVIHIDEPVGLDAAIEIAMIEITLPRKKS